MYLISKLYALDKSINNKEKYSLSKNVIWASPKGFDLAMDIYSPTKEGDSFPVLVMFHGGGFLLRRKYIIENMAQYIASNYDYVVCNVDYRLLRDQKNSVTFDELIGDTFGAMLWIKENIANYKGNRNLIAVTGDSAGAYISAMIVNSGNKLATSGSFSEHLCIKPSYLPESITFDEIKKENPLNIQAAVLSYGRYDLYNPAVEGILETRKNPFWTLAFSKPRGIFGKNFNVKKNPEMYKAISPIYNIPNVDERKLPPQFITSASEDRVTPVHAIEEYVKALEDAGQDVTYWEYKDQRHAYLDSGKTFISGNDFKRDAVPALKKIMDFLNSKLL